jgi:GH25 family lysozyme M1 (1,4-beta-N-acetylmuramidase)
MKQRGWLHPAEMRSLRSWWLLLFAVTTLVASRLDAITLIQGIDISHYQGTINWAQVAADTSKNIKFTFMKATEDVTYTDPTFNTNLAGAKAAGIAAGPYHFSRLDTGSADPVGDAAAEANYFLSKIKSKYQSGTYLPPMSDVETWPSGLTTAALKTLTVAWEKSFSDTIYNSLGVRPFIYTSQSKATSLFSSTNSSTDPLVVAAWHSSGYSSPPANSAVSPWAAWSFWQWSDDTTAYPGNGPINGFASGVRVDRDVYQGTEAQLKALLVGKDPTAKPGDFNRDGLVNLADYNLWSANNGKTVPIYTGADSNGDARVTTADLAPWLANVPEPGSCALLLVGMCALALRSARSCRETAGRM